jgi:magnesium chelatase subunit D
VGALSPHLLDRFSLRLQWQNIESSSLEGEKDLSQRIFQDTSYPDITDISSLPQMKERIQKASEHSAIMTKGAISAIQEYANVLGYFTHRREIALARLASSIAQLKLENQVTEVHVAAAARLIGLNSINDRVDETSQSEEQQIPPSKADEPENAPTENTPMPQQTVDVLAEKQQQVKPQDFELAELEEQIEIAIPTYPYPEDKAPVEREAASLQLPLLQHSESRSAQGVAIGVKRSNTLRDLAIVSTILAAAPFQRIRYNMLEVRYQQLLSQLTREDSDQTQLKSLILKQQHFMNQLQKKSGSRPFLLSKEDLRCYRRSPIANSMLVILLDYTCLRGCSWRQSLLPFLIRAYVERASIYIVRVGMVVADPTLELRAELVKARSILVPSVDESMIESQGKATPLAHGLEIVRQTFRHALQHGRSRVPTGLLVVITDGRGNVPLEDSQMGYITQPVSRKGIEDALKIAQQLRDFKKVEKILLNPQPAYYPDLPITLAEAMGADVENIPHLDEGNELEWNQSRV